jgi:glutamine synthetase
MEQVQGVLAKLEKAEVRKVKLAGCDLDGVLRGKYVSLEKLASALKHGFGFCDVIFGWDVADECYDFPTRTGWHTGYPDLLARVDPATLRLLPGEPGTAFFLCDFWESENTPYTLCPRNLLKRVVARAGEMGFRPRASVEYEFWIFRESPASIHEKGFRDLVPLTPGQFGYSVQRAAENPALVHDLLDTCAALRIELEGLHTETGPGVFEAAIAVQDALEAADRAALFRLTVKEVCRRHGCTATFMARWSREQAGSSGHLHQSLWDRDGERNGFAAGDGPDGEGFSPVMRHFLGGQLALMAEVMPLVCPTINSYKRTVPGAWAPANVAWGIENRTTALRAIRGNSPSATRVEYRLAGADANPYLALAASLATGLYGIEREVEPPAPVAGNAYTAGAPALPRSLEEATAALRDSAAARELFGEEFVRHFTASRDWEVRRFREAVTDWELRRYFEAI